MNENRHLTILSGGGSPHGPHHQPVYQLIASEATRRGVSTHLVDYVGFGHHPDFGPGLNLPRAAEKALTEIRGRQCPDHSTLLCRSFGCYVGVYLLVNNCEEMAAFSRIVLWGPLPYHAFWKLAGQNSSSIQLLNEMARDKGLFHSHDFWITLTPIEELLKGLAGIVVSIGYGTEDQYCDKAFANYIAEIIWRNTKCPVQVAEISGAGHEIRSDASDLIQAEYFALIFEPPKVEGS